MSRIVMLPKRYDFDGTATMIDELVKGGESSILFKHIKDKTSGEFIERDGTCFPIITVANCEELTMCLEPTIKTIGIDNFEYFLYEDIIGWLKRNIRKDYKIIITGKNINIDKFST
jgi:hypothetical protein